VYFAFYFILTKKSYKPRVLTTEVISIITRVLKDMDSNEELLENIPERLLKYEISTQKDIDKLGTKIRKGCLLQAYIKKDGKNYFGTKRRSQHYKNR